MAAAPVSTITLKGLIAYLASQIFGVNKFFAFGAFTEGLYDFEKGATQELGALKNQKIGEYQDISFVTQNKTISVVAVINNVQYLTSSTAIVSGAPHAENAPGATLNVRNIPNNAATLNLCFNKVPAATVSSCKMYFHTAQTSGVSPVNFDIKYYECFHVSTDPAVTGSGLTTWGSIAASSTSFIPLRANPGLSGVNPSGSVTAGTQHDWYICFSATPINPYPKASFNISCMIEYV